MNNCSASIDIPNAPNFKKWKQDLEFSLGIVDLDLTLRETKLVTIFEHLISGLLEKENAKEYLIAIGERFQISDNAESRYLIKHKYEI